jgi:hypothetical protein
MMAGMSAEVQESLGKMVPFPPRLGVRWSTLHWSARSSATKCSTAKQFDSTARYGSRRNRQPVARRSRAAILAS